MLTVSVHCVCVSVQFLSISVHYCQDITHVRQHCYILYHLQQEQQLLSDKQVLEVTKK